MLFIVYGIWFLELFFASLIGFMFVRDEFLVCIHALSDVAFLGRLRKPLEKLRPPSVTELLLSNDGERILEGCLTNFFVVSLKVRSGILSLF